MSARNRSGQALAEFALVLPILLLLLFGVFDFGRAIFMHTNLGNAAREGARLAAVNQDKPTVTTRVVGQTWLTAPTVVISFFLPPADPAVAPSESCGTFTGTGNVQSAPSVGCVIVVDATATFTAITPIIGNLIGPITLQAQSTATVEFSCPRPGVASHPFPNPADCPKQP